MEDMKKLDLGDLGRVTGGLSGFPDGEIPKEIRVCPRCGNKQDLEQLQEIEVESTGHPTIDGTVSDHMYRMFKCSECGFTFWRYGNFWEKA